MKERLLGQREPLIFPTPRYIPNQAIDTPYGRPMPTSEVRPLGISRPVWEKLKAAGVPSFEQDLSKVEEKLVAYFSQKVVDMSSSLEVDCQKSAIMPQGLEKKVMVLTFKGLSKNRKNAFYSGAKNVQRFALSGFVGKEAPASFEVADGVFEPTAAPKVKLSAEERKAQRAAQPKPTLAELAQRAQARADKLKAKADAASGM